MMFKRGVWSIRRPPGQTLSPEALRAEARGGPRLIGRCDSCGLCAEACAVDAITLAPRPQFDMGACIFCGDCAAVCPLESLGMDGGAVAAARQDALDGMADGELEDLREAVMERFGRSLAIRVLDAGSCNACLSEVSALSNPVYDLERFGVKVVASPRHADMLLVCGPLTENMAQALMRSWQAMPEPRLLAAMGACAISGGIFKGSPRCLGALDSALPVDLYIPGCPPSASRLASALCALMRE